MIQGNLVGVGGLLVVAIFIPEFLMRWNHGPVFDRAPTLDASIGAAVALIMAQFSIRRLGRMPLVSEQKLVVPILVAWLAALLAVFSVFRIEFSRFYVGLAFLIAAIWCWGLEAMRTRMVRPRVGVLGAGPSVLAALHSAFELVPMQVLSLTHKIDAAVIQPDAELDLGLSRLVADLVLSGIPVYNYSDLSEGLSGRVAVSTLAELHFGKLVPAHEYMQLKRMFDLLLVVVMAPFAAVILTLAAIATRFDSPGPVFFHQTRMGYRGKPFTCYKLRTMHIGSNGAAFTEINDPRITRLGRFLRQYRIDELPQILNVLKGEMSWIGPRPEAVELASHYAANIAFYEYRHAVRPGISGWAAVHQGNVGEVHAATEKLEYDFFYIKHFSLGLDLLIVWKTVLTVLTGAKSR